MALSWKSWKMNPGDMASDAIAYFFNSILSTLTHWEPLGSVGVNTFDSGKCGGMMTQKVGTRVAVLYWNLASLSPDPMDNTGQLSVWDTRYGYPWPSSYSNYWATALDLEGYYTAKADYLSVTKNAHALFLTGTVTGGPFERGETITIDPGGLAITATVVDHIVDRNTILISNVSASWTTTQLNNKSVTGGTSGASATTYSSYCVGGWQKYDQVSEFHFRGAALPTVGTIVTGQTSGHTGEVDAVDTTNGVIQFINMTGQFNINETVEWNAGAQTATIGFKAHNQKVLQGVSTDAVADWVVDDVTCLVVEDVNQIALFIPDPSLSCYRGFAWGTWLESLEGGGRLDCTYCPNYWGYSAGSSAYIFLKDHNGVSWSGLTDHLGQSRLVPPGVSLSGLSFGATPDWDFYNQTNPSPVYIPHVQRYFGYAYHSNSRNLFHFPELFGVPTSTYRTVIGPGSWSGANPVGLCLSQYLAIEFTDGALSPAP